MLKWNSDNIIHIILVHVSNLAHQPLTNCNKAVTKLQQSCNTLVALLCIVDGGL